MLGIPGGGQRHAGANKRFGRKEAAMVMRPDPRMGALTMVRRRNLGPWWLWSVVVILALVAGYASYIARFSNQRLTDADTAYATLAAQGAKLKDAVAELTDQLDKTTQREAKSRADAEAVSVLVGKLQKRMTELQAELAAAREEAAASKREVAASEKEAQGLRDKAASADTAFEQVRNLQSRIGALKTEADAAHADSDAAHKKADELEAAKAVLEREVAGLKSDLSATQKKLEAATTAAAQAAPQGGSASPH